MNSVFTNLPKNIYIFVYADDIVIVVVGNKPKIIRRKLQAAVRAVAKWADKVGFSMAAEKCSISHFCALKHHPWSNPVTIGGTVIPFKNQLRVLGVTFDRKCNFDTHFKIVKKETKGRIRLIKAISGRHKTSNRSSLQKIGHSIVISKLLYGLEITIRSMATMIHSLSPVYNKMIRLTSGLLPSSPTLSTCVEAGLVPFQFLLTIAASSRAISYVEKTYGDTQNIFILEKAKSLVQEYANIDFPPIAEVHRVGDRRWNHHGPKIDWSVKRSVRAGDPAGKVAAVVNHLLRTKYASHIKIFTDGSRANGTVGIGVHSSSSSVACRLPDQFSIFSAEAAAILHALNSISDNTTPTIILSDSASVLAALENPRQKHPLIQAIDTNARVNITFCWIPGHCGIKGNEEADRLACLGRNSERWNLHIPGPDIRRSIKQSIHRAWEEQWTSNRDLFLRKIKGNTGRWTDRKSQKEQQVLSRLRIGHTRITHPHYISSSPKPTCQCCKVYLTVEHLLVNCPQFDTVRVNLDLGTNIRDILQNDPVNETILIIFLKETKLFFII